MGGKLGSEEKNRCVKVRYPQKEHEAGTAWEN